MKKIKEHIYADYKDEERGDEGVISRIASFGT